MEDETSTSLGTAEVPGLTWSHRAQVKLQMEVIDVGVNINNWKYISKSK